MTMFSTFKWRHNGPQTGHLCQCTADEQIWDLHSSTSESTRICIPGTRQSLQLLDCNMSPMWKLYSASVILSAIYKLLLQISWASDACVIIMLDTSCPDSCLPPRHILPKSSTALCLHEFQLWFYCSCGLFTGVWYYFEHNQRDLTDR